MYLINRFEPDPFLMRVGPSGFQNWVESGWVGPHGQNSGRVHLAFLVNIHFFLMWPHLVADFRIEVAPEFGTKFPTV